MLWMVGFNKLRHHNTATLKLTKQNCEGYNDMSNETFFDHLQLRSLITV